MMKYVFALVLLHLCHGATFKRNVTFEMSKYLSDLHNSFNKNKVNFTSPTNVNIPGRYMKNNPASCIGVFKVEMMHLLDSLTTVHKDVEDTIEKLRGNLEVFEPHAKTTDTNCTMKVHKNNYKSAFLQYKQFILRLNSRN